MTPQTYFNCLLAKSIRRILTIALGQATVWFNWYGNEESKFWMRCKFQNQMCIQAIHEVLIGVGMYEF